MSADSIDSISEFLLHAGTNYQVFDMARGIIPVSTQAFMDMESGKIAPPRPRLKHAWFGILFWNGAEATQHYIWFIKLPLDERGLIISASRNHFLQIILEALIDSENQDVKTELPNTPYSFQPSQLQMAQFSSLSRKSLNIPVTNEAIHALAYLKTPKLLDWQKVSYQGIVDNALAIADTQITDCIIENFEHYPFQVTAPLLQGLENVEKNDKLVLFLLDKFDKTFGQEQKTSEALHLLQSLACEKPVAFIQAKLSEILSTKSSISIDLLSLICSRHYIQLSPALLLMFFEQVVKTDSNLGYKGELYLGFFTDLVQIPQLRNHVLSYLHSTKKTEHLRTATEKLVRQLKQ